MKGLRPELPDDILPQFRQLITQCWDEDPSNRPTFGELVLFLAGLSHFVLFELDRKNHNFSFRVLDTCETVVITCCNSLPLDRKSFYFQFQLFNISFRLRTSKTISPVSKIQKINQNNQINFLFF